MKPPFDIDEPRQPGPFGPRHPRRGPHHGPRGPYGGGRRGRRGGRRPRGDVRAAVLLLLDEEPRHGYDLIQEISQRSNGAWTPSPGSIYPSLQQLEDEGLVSFDRVGGRNTAQLTTEGTAYVEEHRDELGSPWEDVDGGDSASSQDFRGTSRAVIDAYRQVLSVGTPAQAAKASEVMNDARKTLYGILADDEPTD